MLAKRVIIQLCFEDGVLMRTKKFVPDYRYTQNWSWSENADELVMVDVSRNRDDSIFLPLVEKYCRNSGLPMTIANHIASAEDAAPLFDCGADRVLVSYKRKHCYEEIAGRWGSNALVAGIDYRSNSTAECGEDKIMGQVGFWGREAVRLGAGEIRKHVGPASGIAPSTASETNDNEVWCDGDHTTSEKDIQADRSDLGGDRRIHTKATEAVKLGAGEILLTDIDRDGSLLGYDLPTLRACRAATTASIIVSGGCGNVFHVQEAFQAGADGACTSVIHHLSDTSMRGWKQHLTAMEMNVRPVV